jgi:hypothetical protein
MWTEFLLTGICPYGKILECTTLLNFGYMQECLRIFNTIREDSLKEPPILKRELNYNFYKNYSLYKIEPCGELIVKVNHKINNKS